MGLMLYFGDTKVKASDNHDKEKLYRKDFLKHCILGLATVQHGGNMVLKIYEAYTPFTAGLLFMLYHMFRVVTVVKPFNTSFLSSRQYIVCKGLKQRRPKEILGYLIGILRNLDDPKKDEFTKCNGLFRYMENEDKFLTYVKNHTQALTSL